DEVLDWYNGQINRGIRVKASIFDEKGKLRILTPEEWDEENVVPYSLEPKKAETDTDDVPF
ncbi:MAG TPA: hypothetical protein VGA66_08205, partial [Mycobacterium sp.]